MSATREPLGEKQIPSTNKHCSGEICGRNFYFEDSQATDTVEITAKSPKHAKYAKKGHVRPFSWPQHKTDQAIESNAKTKDVFLDTWLANLAGLGDLAVVV